MSKQIWIVGILAGLVVVLLVILAFLLVVRIPDIQRTVRQSENLSSQSDTEAISLATSTPTEIPLVQAPAQPSVIPVSAMDCVRFIDEMYMGTVEHSKAIDEIDRRLGDGLARVQAVQNALNRRVAQVEIILVLLQIKPTSVLSLEETFVGVSQVVYVRADQLMLNWSALMIPTLRDIDAGNGSFLEDAGLIGSSTRVLLDYAEAQKVILPLLVPFQRSRALAEAIIHQNQHLQIEEVDRQEVIYHASDSADMISHCRRTILDPLFQDN